MSSFRALVASGSARGAVPTGPIFRRAAAAGTERAFTSASVPCLVGAPRRSPDSPGRILTGCFWEVECSGGAVVVAEVTGVLAVLLIFLSGPYRTLQKRLPRRWGPVLSVWAHSNVSLAAAAAVFVHLLLVGEFELKAAGFRGNGLTWVATFLLATSLSSGLFGLYIATGSTARRRWLRFHRILTSVFYLAIVPHVVTEGVLQWPVFLLLAGGWGIAAGRRRIRGLLSRVSWPFSAPKTEGQPDRRGAGRTMRRLVRPLAAALAAAGIVGGLFVVKDLGRRRGRGRGGGGDLRAHQRGGRPILNAPDPEGSDTDQNPCCHGIRRRSGSRLASVAAADRRSEGCSPGGRDATRGRDKGRRARVRRLRRA